MNRQSIIAKFALPLLAFLLSAGCYAKTAADPGPFGTIQKMFAATSAADHAQLKSTVTDDFQLLEMGEVWNTEDFLRVLKPSKRQRLNFFAVISTQIEGNIAWISYWNKATVINGEERRDIMWLESAVLVKQAEQWKIQLLHSTRLMPEKFPQDLKMVEYVE